MAKGYVSACSAKINGRSSFNTHRVTKVTACATVVATRALTNLKQISKSGLSEKDEERLSFVIKDLTLQKTGLEHELNIVKIVEKRGFSFTFSVLIRR